MGKRLWLYISCQRDLPYCAAVKKLLLIPAVKTRRAEKARMCVSAVVGKGIILSALYPRLLRQCFCSYFVAFLEDEQREYGDKQL